MHLEVEGLWWLLSTVIRLLLIVIIQLYTTPPYLAWVLLFLPLRFIWPRLYWYVESRIHRCLLTLIVHWINAINYSVELTGDDITPCLNERCLILVNHQTTADVPLLVYAFYEHERSLGTSMWIIDNFFRWTSFGLVSWVRGDFFITQGKAVREAQLRNLRQHLQDNYFRRKKKWIYLFPEGGFLRKRRGVSQSYAKKCGHPVLQHVTLPRLGAIQTIIDALQPNGKSATHEEPLKWILDVTIAYHKDKPLDITTAFTLQPPSYVTYFHHRLYPIDSLPVHDEDKMKAWIYRRWTEKEALLDQYYRTAIFPAAKLPDSHQIHFNPFAILFTHLFFLVCTSLLAYFSSILLQGSYLVVPSNW